VAASAEVTVELRLPFDDAPAFRITGSARDESIPAMIRAAGGLYEPEVMRALRANLPADGVAIDVGANLGAIAVALAWMAPRGRVYAFEPAPANFAFLERNLAQNGACGAIALPVACSDAPGSIELHYIEQFAGGAFAASSGFVDGREQTIRIPRLTLDGFAALQGLARVDLVKVDVEGAEEEAIAGAAELLRRFRPRLVVEFNPSTARIFHRRTLQGLHGRIAAHGYEMAFIERPSGSLHPTGGYADLMGYVERQGGVGDVLCTPRAG
jgi:FkbM family methyltransferase